MHGEVHSKHSAISIFDQHFHVERSADETSFGVEYLLDFTVGKAVFSSHAADELSHTAALFSVPKIVAPIDEVNVFAHFG